MVHSRILIFFLLVLACSSLSQLLVCTRDTCLLTIYDLILHGFTTSLFYWQSHRYTHHAYLIALLGRPWLPSHLSFLLNYYIIMLRDKQGQSRGPRQYNFNKNFRNFINLTTSSWELPIHCGWYNIIIMFISLNQYLWFDIFVIYNFIKILFLLK